tara:strand:+ start:1868 stop:2617 length:750 start_codon:yes stop_codon:yes gene_type:complete
MFLAVKRIYLNKGDIYHTNAFGDMEILYHNDSRDVGIRFIATGYISTGVQVGNVVRGNVADRLVPTVMGKGYLNTDEKVTGTQCYMHWHSMLERAYSEKYHLTRPTYRDVEVCEEWYDFTEFRVWFNKQEYTKGFHLDKDLFGNSKLYSPNNCCFLPARLNSVLTDNESRRGDCPLGVSKRKKKGTQEYNGLYNASIFGAYLGRFTCPLKAGDLCLEFKQLGLECLADQYYELGIIDSCKRDAFYNHLK